MMAGIRRVVHQRLADLPGPNPTNIGRLSAIDRVKKIKKSDGEVDFEDAGLIYNKYRAFEGWPGIFTTNGTKLDGVSLIDTTSDNRVLEILSFDEESVVVGCRKGALKIATLQPASKKAMSAKAYCVGRGLKVGDTLL